MNIKVIIVNIVVFYFHSAVNGIKDEVSTEDSQRGELAHVREG